MEFKLHTSINMISFHATYVSGKSGFDLHMQSSKAVTRGAEVREVNITHNTCCVVPAIFGH